MFPFRWSPCHRNRSFRGAKLRKFCESCINLVFFSTLNIHSTLALNGRMEQPIPFFIRLRLTVARAPSVDIGFEAGCSHKDTDTRSRIRECRLRHQTTSVWFPVCLEMRKHCRPYNFTAYYNYDTPSASG